MLDLFLDTQTREWFDGNGELFANSFPKIPLGNTEKVTVKCGAFSVDDNSGERIFTPDSSFNRTGVAALLSIDNNFTRHLKGSIAEDITAGNISNIKLVINNASRGKIPPAGAVRFFDPQGNIEAIEYTSRNISGNIVEFICAAGSAVQHSYPKNASADCPESLYAQAAWDAANSNLAQGVFVFNITVDSEKLREKADYADIEYINDVKGMELLIFGVEDNKIITYNSFLCDTVSIPVPMADPNPNPQMPDTYKDNIAAITSALISAGFDIEVRENNGAAEIRIKLANQSSAEWSDWTAVGYSVRIQYSNDNSNWHDTATENDKYIRTSVDGGKNWSMGLRFQGSDGQSGSPAGFGYITATIKSLPADSNPAINISANGENTAKNLIFEFEIPAGKDGEGLNYDASGTSLIDRSLYDDRPTGFKFAYAAADQETFRTTLYIYTKLSDNYADWSEALAIVFYGASKPEVTSIRPVEFTPPPDTDKVYYFAIPAPLDATIAQVCIDTDEGELILPYYSDLGVRKILKKNEMFYIYFGNSVPKYAKGRVYLTQMVAADKSESGGGGDITVVGGTMYYGYLPSSSDFQSVTAITADMIDEDTITAADASAVGAISLGNVPAGTFTVVLVPADSGLTVKKDDGLGGKVGFEIDNGIAGSGANGATVTLGENTYKVYGEFNLVDGATTIYIN